MTTFHESLKNIISEFEKFLVETLKKEKLSSASKDHKQQILEKISQLREEYPPLRPDELNINKSRQALFFTPRPMRRSTSYTNSPRTLSHSSSLMMLWKRLSHWDLDKVDDESTRTGGSSNADSADDPYSDQGIPDIAASDLKDVSITGYLEKKQKKGILNTGKLQKRYCVVKGDIFYYYEKEKDKKQKGAFRLTGYEFRQCPDLVKDQNKKDLSFELVGGEKRIYQFIAPSKDDFENWKKVFMGDSGDFDDDQDIYEPIDPEPEPVRTPKPKVSETIEADDFYSDPADSESAKMNSDELIEDDVYEDTGNVNETKDSPRSPTISKPNELVQDIEYDDTANLTPPVPDRPLPRTPPPLPDSKPPDLPGRGRVPNLPPPPIPHEGSATSETLPPPPPSMDLPPIPTESPPQPKKKKVLPRDQDFENLYYGIWDCKADGPDELSFCKGDMILIINRDFDDKKWWVGELKGRYGLVPKNYLANAYTPATA